MSFTPQCYSNYYSFSNGFCDFSTPANDGDGVGVAMWCEQNLNFFDNIDGVANYMVPQGSELTSSPISIMSFPCDVDSAQATWNMPAVVPEMTMSFGTGNRPEGHEFVEECSGFASNFWTDNHTTAINNWKIKGEQVGVQESEEPAMKVGRYSVEEKKNRILRYLKKRNQRNFKKTIKYECRKTLADKRVRVRGRFAKNNMDASEDETITKNNNNLHQISPNRHDDFFQIKHDEEDEWVEAIASFMYFPYIN